MNDQNVSGEGEALETGAPDTEPHATSMAVWDVPSPAVISTRLALKVGVSCSAGCRLTGAQVEVYDRLGARVASGVLGDNPWLSSGSLYWTEVELEAPGVEGYHDWTARFPEPGLELSHEEASHGFGFRTVKQPDHTVTIEVTDKDTDGAIADADVFLHPYRGRSDEHGMSRLMVPEGEYELLVLVAGKQPFATSVSVAGDVVVKVELLVEPPRRETYP